MPLVTRLKNLVAPKKAADRRMERETAKAKSDLKSLGGLLDYEFDDLAEKMGGVEVYQKMLRDERVWTGLRRVQGPIAALPWHVEPYLEPGSLKPTPADEEAADFCEHVLRRMRGHFSKDLWDVLDALVCGFSIAEMVFELVPAGRWAGKIGLKALKSKDPKNYRIETDEFLNITGLRNFATNYSTGDPLEIERFVHFAPFARYERPEGWSLLRPAYRFFWIKDTVLKLRAVFAERFAQGTVVGKYNPANAECKAAMKTLVQNFKGEVGVLIPNDAEIEIVQAATASEDVFKAFIDDCNESILVAIVGSTLETQEGEKTGALRMGLVHKATAQISVELIATWLADVLTEQVCERLVRLNFASANTPTFGFDLDEPADLGDTAEALDKVVNRLGIAVPAAWARGRLGIPEPAEGEEVLEAKPEPVMQPGKPNVPGKPDGLKNVPGDDPPEQFAEGGNDAADLRFVSVQRIEEATAGLIKRNRKAGLAAFAAMFESVEEPIKSALAAGDLSDVLYLRPVTDELESFLQELLLTSRLTGMLHGFEEMRREWKELAPADVRFPEFRPFDVPDVIRFAEEDEDEDELLTIAEAARKFSGRIPMTRDLFVTLARKVRDEAFFVAGLTAGEGRNDIQPLVKRAIEQGLSWEQFQDALAGLASELTDRAWVERQYPGAFKLVQRPYHAENVFRTNVMGAYNQGRRSAFEDPSVAAEFPAWQYSAILDERTRATHAAMDGKVYRADDPIWAEWYPPNGYQCRCFVIPVSRWRFEEAMLSGPVTIKADAGFGAVAAA